MAEPPVAKKVPTFIELHGDRIQDDYAWLRDKDDPEVTAYLEAENAYADAVMKPTVEFQEALYKEMLARIKEDDQSVPYVSGGGCTTRGRRRGSSIRFIAASGRAEAAEEVTLDLNALAEGHAFLALGAYTVSDDGRWLAYSVDYTGFREYTLCVKDLASGELQAERIEKVSSVAWAADSATIFYVLEDAAKRPYRLLRHRLGAPVAEDPLLYEEADELFRLGVWRSRSRSLLFAASGSFTATEYRYLSAGEPTGAWSLLLARQKDHEYSVDHGAGPAGGVFYIRTNADGRRNFRLVAAPVADPGAERWQELIAHRDDVMLEDIDVFAGHYVVHERADGLIRLRVTELTTGNSHHVEFPEPTYELSGDVNAEFALPAYRFRYQSFITPASVYDYDVAGRKLMLLKQTPVLGGYDPTRYRSERIHAIAADGARVPISLVSPVGDAARRLEPALPGRLRRLRHPVPGHLLVEPAEPARARRDGGHRPHPRGRRARQALARRRADAEQAQHVHRLHRRRRRARERRGYAARDRLVIEGGSAGGLLMGAVLNLRPDLVPRRACSGCRSWTSSTRCSTSRCRSPSASSRSGATPRSASTTST